MARKIAEGFVRLRPDTARFAEEATPHFSTAGNKLGDVFAGAFTSAFRRIGAAIGGIFAIQQVIGFLHEANEEQRESQRLTRLTEAVIKSTGGAANVTADQIGKLSDKLAALSGVDDEVIQAGANMLLTFREVKNGVGAGNQIFDRAAQAILDMSVAMNNGTTSEEALRATSLQVGKALNDPILGMNALRRAGVTFSEQQKEQIKNFQQAGDLMSAQKIILKELEVEFGGAAAAAADPAQRAQVAWANFKEELGKFTLPVVNAVATFFTDKLLPAIDDKVIPALKRLRDWFRDEVGPVINDKVLPVLRGLRDFFTTEVVPTIKDKVIPALSDFKDWLETHVYPALVKVYDAVNTLKVSMDQIKGTFDNNKDSLTGLLGSLKENAEGFLNVLGPVLAFVFKVQVIIDQIGLQILTTFLGIIGRIVQAEKDFTEGAAKWLHERIDDINRFVEEVKRKALGAGRAMVEGFMEGVRSLGGWLVNQLTTWAEEHIPAPIRAVLKLGSPSRLMREYGQDTVRGFVLGLQDGAKMIAANAAKAIAPAAQPPAAAPAPSNVQQVFNLVGPSVSELAAQVNRELNWGRGA